MPSTYSSLKVQLMATGENNTTWGDVTNVNLGTALEEAIVGSADVAFSNANVTLTLTDTNASQTARNMRLNLTGTATSGYNLVVPSIEKPYIINNGTDGTITVKNATGTGIAVPAGKTMWVYNDGTNVVDAVTRLSSLTLGTALVVGSGGTGANTFTSNGVLLGNGTSAISATAAGTTGQVLVGNTGSAPSWATLSGIGVTSFSAGTTGLTPSTGTTGAVTLAGTLNVANGGTGATSLTSGYLVKGNGTSAASASVVYDDGTNVGIGNSSPSSYGKFSVTGTLGTVSVDAGGNILGFSRAGLNYIYAPSGGFSYAGSPHIFTDGSLTTEWMRINSSGNVGIGTSSPGFRLTAVGASTAGSVTALAIENPSTNAASEVRQEWRAGGSSWAYATASYNSNSPYMAFGVSAASSAPTERMRIDSSGNVGIGTTAPTSYSGYGNLTVNGTNGGTFTLRNTANTSSSEMGATATDAYLKTVSSTPLWFGTGNTEYMRITSAGNVGIGTSSPGARLTVQDSNQLLATFNSTSANAGYAQFQSSGANFGYIGSGASLGAGTATDFTVRYQNNLIFNYQGGEIARFDSSGNLGLGVTPSAWINSYRAFNIGDSGLISSRTGASINNVEVGVNWFRNSGGSFVYKANGYGTNYQQFDGAHYWYTAPSGTAGTAISFTQAMTLDASGNLGIGTSGQPDKLFVYANTASSALAVRNDGGGPLQTWATFGTERMRIDSSGNVGIGTSSPGVTLDVNGATRIQSSFFVYGSGDRLNVLPQTAGSGVLLLTTNNANSAYAPMTLDGTPMIFNYAGGEQMRLTSSGLTLNGALSNLYIQPSTNTNNSLVRCINGGGTAYIGLDGSSSGLGGSYSLNMWHSGAYPIVFSNNNTERMRIDSSGNLGVGTSAPATRLNVDGGSLATGGNGILAAGSLSAGRLISGGGATVNAIHTYYDDRAYELSAGSTSGYVSGVVVGGRGYTGTGGDAVTLWTRSAERVRIDSSGNVGIGTSSPNAKLTVNGDITSNKFAFYNEGSGANYNYTGYVRFANGGTESMRIDSSGNVGIGTSSPGYNLEVAGAVRASIAVRGNYAGGTDIGHLRYLNANGSQVADIFAENTNGGASDSATLNFSTTSAGTSAVKMKLDSSGNFIVGGTSATNTASGRGNITLNGSSSAIISIGVGGSEKGYIYTQGTDMIANAGTGSFTVQTAGAQPVVFGTSGSERARINSDGTFLLAKSAVQAAAVGVELRYDGGSTFSRSGATSATSTLEVYSTGAGAYRFYVDMSGTVFATSTTISAISDIRLKENVRELDAGLDVILALKPRRFDWKEGKGKDVKDDMGFIAQEVEEVLPALIGGWKAGEGEPDDLKSVKAGDLIPVLVKAIQELTARVAQLEGN